jgi:hypothetical protein
MTSGPDVTGMMSLGFGHCQWEFNGTSEFDVIPHGDVIDHGEVMGCRDVMRI